MKTEEEIATQHDVYLFDLNTDATLFYNQCRNILQDGFYSEKRGIVVISGKEVTCPEWMPLQPFQYKSKTSISL